MGGVLTGLLAYISAYLFAGLINWTATGTFEASVAEIALIISISAVMKAYADD